MWYTFFFAAALLVAPLAGFAEEPAADTSPDVEVETDVQQNLGQTIKDDCAGLSGTERVACLREVLKTKSQSKSRAKSERGRGRAAEAFGQFEKTRGKVLKEVGSGERAPKVYVPIQQIGKKVKYITKEERKMLKGKMNEEKGAISEREESRRAKVDSLKKRIHQR